MNLFVLYLSNSLLAEARHLDTSLALAHRRVKHFLISGDRCRTCVAKTKLRKPSNEVYLNTMQQNMHHAVNNVASTYNLGKSCASLNYCIAGNVKGPHRVVTSKLPNDPSHGRQATSSGVRYHRSLNEAMHGKIWPCCII